MSTQGRQSADSAAPFAARISDAPIGAARQAHRLRWLTILTVFMRLVAVLWLIKGIYNWAAIIGIFDASFGDLRLSRQGAIIAMAVLDLVAAVGMWLTSSWGVAVWLIVLAVEATLPFLMPDLDWNLLVVVVPGVLAVLYIFLVWRAAHEEHGG